MPAPANDNIANAQSLGTGEPGVVYGTNVSATSEVGEPANNGSTVWYYWTNQIQLKPLSGSAPAGAWSGFRMRFGTRWRPGQLTSTNFLTKVDVFKANVWPITGFGDLSLIVSGTRSMGNWEDQSQVEFDVDYLQSPTTPVAPDPFNAPDGVHYYIRVDGAAAGLQGSFALWWEMKNELYSPAACGDCPPSPIGTDPVRGSTGDANPCLLVWAPSPNYSNDGTFQNEVTQVYPVGGGNAAQGYYRVRHCGGAVFYGAGWAVGRIPASRPQTWAPGAPRVTGYMFAFTYHDGGGVETNVLPEPQPPAYGWHSSWLAMDNIGCGATFDFYHDGTTPITLSFNNWNLDDIDSDMDVFVEQTPGGVGHPWKIPKWTLSKVQADWVATTCCTQAKSGANFTIRFNMTVYDDRTWNNITATVRNTGGVASSTAHSGLTIINGNTGFNITNLTISNPANLSNVATIDFTDTNGFIIATLVWDMTPYVTATVTLAGASCGRHKRANVSFTHFGLDNGSLVATCTLGGDISATTNDSGCVVTNAFSVTAFSTFCTAAPSIGIDYDLTNPSATVATMNFTFADGGWTGIPTVNLTLSPA